MRMKNLMIAHVTNQRGGMFRDATDKVQKQLEDLCHVMQQEMEAQMQEVQQRLTRDYLSVLVGADAASMKAGVPRVELMLRAEMALRLGKADGAFAKLFSQEASSPSPMADGSSVHGEEPPDDDFVKNESESKASGSVAVKDEAD